MQLTDLIVDFDAIELPINLMGFCGFCRRFISMNRRHDNTIQTIKAYPKFVQYGKFGFLQISNCTKIELNIRAFILQFQLRGYKSPSDF